MDPNRPRATHVAVRDGRVLGVGTLEGLAGWGPYRLDDRFAARVLMPGFVEGHAHAMTGNLWLAPAQEAVDMLGRDGHGRIGGTPDVERRAVFWTGGKSSSAPSAKMCSP